MIVRTKPGFRQEQTVNVVIMDKRFNRGNLIVDGNPPPTAEAWPNLGGNSPADVWQNV